MSEIGKIRDDGEIGVHEEQPVKFTLTLDEKHNAQIEEILRQMKIQNHILLSFMSNYICANKERLSLISNQSLDLLKNIANKTGEL